MKTTWHLFSRGDIRILQVGDLLSEHITKAILQDIDEELLIGHHNYIVDMSSVNYINSIGLNLLIILKERIRKQRGRLVLAQLSPTVVQLLTMTKLQPLFELADSVEVALDTFAAENK